MSILFFNLRGVPEDEADDIRDLLTANEVGYYETSAGSWGISTPAIWLYNAEDETKIRPLFEEYQQQRLLTQRANYLALKKQGMHPGFFRHNLKKPLHFLLYSGVIAITLYVSIKWLFDLGL